jgi:hypothetical protein
MDPCAKKCEYLTCIMNQVKADVRVLLGARIFKFLGSTGIDSKESIPPAYVACAGIFKQSMGARNQVGIRLSYRPARLHRLAEFIPWNRFLGSINI